MKLCKGKWLWRKLSITKKVAALIVVVLSLFFMLVLIGQSVFFGRVYMYQKKDALFSAVKSISSFYTTASDTDEIQQYITETANHSSSDIMILNSDGNIVYSVTYQMTVQDENGNTIRFLLTESARDKKLSELHLREGSYVEVEYMYFDDSRTNAYFPLSISASGEELISRPPALPDTHENEIRRVRGKITSITLPFKNNPSSKPEAMHLLMQWTKNDMNSKSFKESGSFYKIEEASERKMRYMIVAQREENSDIVFAVSPLVDVSQTSRLFRRATIPWISISVCLALIVAIIFSKFVTNPLLSITRVTTKMKNLDFSEKCRLASEDELGRLGNNINEMSDKLDSTITQLIDANEKLKADIEKDRIIEQQRKDFVAAVSHELKTPLAIIRAYTEGVIDGVSENKRQRYMEVIINETEKMDSLILSMLENSRLEAGVEKLYMKKHDMCKLVRNTKAVFEQAAAKKKITLCTDISKTPVICEFDIDKIEQVINNFLSNAIKHTPPEGAIYINVCENEDTCTVSVENEGSEISEEELPLVWDRFYKSDKSRDRSDGSTGLGLSIAKNILKLHSAQYGVENTGRGVKFQFTLKKI